MMITIIISVYVVGFLACYRSMYTMLVVGKPDGWGEMCMYTFMIAYFTCFWPLVATWKVCKLILNSTWKSPENLHGKLIKETKEKVEIDKLRARNDQLEKELGIHV